MCNYGAFSWDVGAYESVGFLITIKLQSLTIQRLFSKMLASNTVYGVFLKKLTSNAKFGCWEFEAIVFAGWAHKSSRISIRINRFLRVFKVTVIDLLVLGIGFVVVGSGGHTLHSHRFKLVNFLIIHI